MKLLFDHNQMCDYFEDSNIKFGIGWYRHHKDHPWFGFSLEFYLLYWMFSVTFVSDFDAYDRKINYRKYRK